MSKGWGKGGSEGHPVFILILFAVTMMMKKENALMQIEFEFEFEEELKKAQSENIHTIHYCGMLKNTLYRALDELPPHTHTLTHIYTYIGLHTFTHYTCSKDLIEKLL